MLRLSVFLTFILSCCLLIAQEKKQSPDKQTIAAVPDSLSHSLEDLSGFFISQCKDPVTCYRVIFRWITTNIRYDMDNMFTVYDYQSKDEIVKDALSQRKGVCMHFAELFNAIARRCGLRSYTVPGYTRQNGLMDLLPHLWCAVETPSGWYFIDPAWGSGHVENNTFIRKVNDFYFLTKPEDLIQSHMPFDPLWQLLPHPLTAKEFYDGLSRGDPKRGVFNYSDSIAAYDRQSEIERLRASERRIQANGVTNAMTYERLEHIKREIAFHRNKSGVEQYNLAVHTYNEGIQMLNSFIQYRNRQFNPKKTDAAIMQMIDTIHTVLSLASSQLKAVADPDESTAASCIQLENMIRQATQSQQEHKAFVDKYIATAKPFRKTLFYK
ncbi:MAG TPA: transglutaminase domain-containing protein [Bacteroidales bacterium]|nr:transglutaminase domain-containing protein [Bacteroidales bacterium]HSA44359.1 transglutaminase domain-containing protein [Bacteroidales bacterium]